MNRVDFRKLKVGDRLKVPARRSESTRPRPDVTRLEIDLERKLVLLIHEDREGRSHLHGLLHCSIARNPAKAPRGSFEVKTVARNPDYTFDPADWPEVRGVDRKLRIPPGPRNPVGLCWIGLDKKGIGIHGTPKPQSIGKTGSHGCFRLTNWDVTWLSRLVRGGTPVKVCSKRSETSWP